MKPWVPIQYRDFWDLPRIFIASYDRKLFLFDCPFDETAEDYPETYKVYILPGQREEELTGSWDKLHLRASHFLGEVPISKVEFDPTRRQGIQPSVLEELAAEARI